MGGIKMNVIKLMGGLGNQLYQYAFGQAQKANGIEVSYDRSWFDYRQKGSFRYYQLDKFDIEVPFSLFLNQQEIHEKGYEPILLTVDNCNFWGYWQYLSYYQPILKELQDTLKVKESFYTTDYISLLKTAENRVVTGVHVRRGDYLTTTGFKVLPFSYYLQALNETRGDLIFIFSDDMPWVVETFKRSYFTKQLVYVYLQDYLSWDLMRRCQNLIIANSSFSQWAAFVNESTDKKIIYSSEITIEGGEEQERQNNFPKEWVKV
jgi:hypothetical protein